MRFKVSNSGVVTLRRRQFLRGIGGTLLAMPLLPSLLEREAAAAPSLRPKNFIAMGTSHGGAWFSDMFPATSTLTESMTYAGRTIRRGKLAPAVSGGTAALSRILSAPSSRLTPALLAKMNVIAGLDVINSGHHTGSHLGNWFANDGTLGQPPSLMIPTIDQVMAYSSSFYPNLGGVLKRSLQFGNHQGWGGMSFNYANPTARTGDVVPLYPSNDSLQAFQDVFLAPSAAPISTRTPVVDRVFENYQRLRQSDRRLSAGDRRRLDDHMERLAEIQRRAGVRVSCGGLPTPTRNARTPWESGPSGSSATEAFQLINDVIVAALLCGTCRIVTVGAVSHSATLFSSYVGDWHQSVAHVASQGDPASTEVQNARDELVRAYQGYFEKAFLDLASKLDVDNGAGGTLLDDTLLQWTHESCHSTHDGWSIPVVTAGSAGGSLKTGSFIDYRNLAIGSDDVRGGYRPGLMWNQLLGTTLQAMGIPRSEYEIARYQPSRPSGSGTGGYGWWRFDPAGYVPKRQEHYQSQLGSLGEKLPYLGA